MVQINSLLRAISRATLGNLLGRAANVLIPLRVLVGIGVGVWVLDHWLDKATALSPVPVCISKIDVLVLSNGITGFY